MLYSVLRSLIRLSLSVFFKKFNVVGQDNVPSSGPVIFVANHPSAVMDPLITGASLNKKLFFLAGSEWIGKGFKAKVYKKQFNMIPVHRPWLAEGKEVSNDKMFQDSYKKLDNDDWILIFPEATTKTLSKVRDLKTGAIRIKEGFEKYTNYKKSVPIIPIGLNYSNPHQFQSNVIVNIGKPVEFKENCEGLEKKERLRIKTDEIKKALEESIINIRTDDNKSLIRKINQIFIEKYREEKGISRKDSASNFAFLQKLSKAIEYFEVKDPLAYLFLSKRINKFFENLNNSGFSNDMVSKPSKFSISFLNTLFVILGVVPAVLSGLMFAFPYFLTKILFKKKLKQLFREKEEDPGLDPAFTGSLTFLSGILIFLLWSLVISMVCGFMIGNWLIVPFALVMSYQAYKFYLFYLRKAIEFSFKIKGAILRMRYRNKHEELYQVQTSIIELLKEYQKQYSLIN